MATITSAIMPIEGPVPWRDGDVFLCAYPKSGRTWIKQFLAQYLSLTFKLGYQEGFNVNELMKIVPSEWFLRRYPATAFIYGDDPRVPRIRFTHYAFHDLFIGRPVIWLTRGVEDTLVSCWYHQGCPETGGGFVRGLVGHYVDWMTGWLEGISETSRWLHITYEGLWADTASEFRNIIDFIGLPYNKEYFSKALFRASFDQMRKDQEASGVKEERARRGVVGGYRDELSPEDIKFIRDAIRARGDDGLCFFCGMAVETRKEKHG